MKATALGAALIVAAGLAAYAPGLHGVLVADDLTAIDRNPYLQQLWPLTSAMSAPEQSTLSGRPIAALSFAITHALAGGDPTARVWWHHAGNIGIHLLAALTLFGVVRRTPDQTAGLRPLASEKLRDPLHSSRSTSRRDLLATAMALLWVVHPLTSAAVAYVVQRVESLMALFYLLTLYCAIRAFQSVAAPERRRWTIAAIVACAFGMGTKEVMVTAPIAVLLWRWIFVRAQNSDVRPKAGLGQGFGQARRSAVGAEAAQGTRPKKGGGKERLNSNAATTQRPRPWGERFSWAWGLGPWAWLLAGLFATWLILILLVSNAPRSLSVGWTLDGWTPWTYLLTQTSVIVHYLRLAIVPMPLVFDYDWPRVTSLAAAAPYVIALGAALIATVAGIRRRHPLAFPAAVFFLALAPSSSVLPIATEVAAEHRMYLPLAAVIVLLVSGARWLGRVAGMPARTAAIAGVAATAVLATGGLMLTRARQLDYTTAARLWDDTRTKRPANARAHHNYGLELLDDGRYGDAAASFDRAIALQPALGEALIARGLALCSLKRVEDGRASFERALIVGGYSEEYRTSARVKLAAVCDQRAR